MGRQASTPPPGTSAELLGGDVRLTGKAAVLQAPVSYQTQTTAHGISLGQLTALSAAASDDSHRNEHGRLYIQFEGSGDTAMPVRNTAGAFRIEEAEIYSVPVISSLIVFIRAVFPRLTKRQPAEKAAQIHGTYAITDGVVGSNNVSIARPLGRIQLCGEYDPRQGVAALTGTLRLKGVGLVTGRPGK